MMLAADPLVVYEDPSEDIPEDDGDTEPSIITFAATTFTSDAAAIAPTAFVGELLAAEADLLLAVVVMFKGEEDGEGGVGEDDDEGIGVRAESAAQKTMSEYPQVIIMTANISVSLRLGWEYKHAAILTKFILHNGCDWGLL